ncbi:MAG: type II toxin-antitoxin system prevent-host-death family antitoxin [Phycisphaera sp.]|nr:type II toxin-antitoxin system prevent-host-death family antitoxin [Phycisphaera sp.]
MVRMKLTDVRQNLPDTISRVVYGGERVVVRRHGSEVAALVSMADLSLLERLEDLALGEEALARLRDEKPEPFRAEPPRTRPAKGRVARKK